ncbi:hypothetical protein KBTX_00667 [wastewater metagenome]|uniref:DUF429 domain-containing protein n=2 Tax=unclassified sequences TaxID=12908 RepID=A0A5B8R618_9ZZZZ|nr:hypothetical protein KBTEX_00667 [uncultured organism]
MIVAGMDGCRGRWLCVWGDPGVPGALRARLLDEPPGLLTLAPAPVTVGADIPIGLPETGPRTADRMARQRLGRPRGSSVFPAPLRPMLAAGDYAEACRIGRSRDGRALSRQTWQIVPLIAAMDAFVLAAPARQGWVREAHPELAFQAWNGGIAMAHGKKRPAGRAEREALVETTFPDALAGLRLQLVGQGYAADDLLDAMACFRTAARIAVGEAEWLPANPERDARRLAMEIVV